MEKLIKTMRVNSKEGTQIMLKTRDITTREACERTTQAMISFYYGRIQPRRMYAMPLDGLTKHECPFDRLPEDMLRIWCNEIYTYPENKSIFTDSIKNIFRISYGSPEECNKLVAMIRSDHKLRRLAFLELSKELCFHGSDVNIEDHAIHRWTLENDPEETGVNSGIVYSALDIESDIRSLEDKFNSYGFQERLRKVQSGEAGMHRDVGLIITRIFELFGENSSATKHLVVAGLDKIISWPDIAGKISSKVRFPGMDFEQDCVEWVKKQQAGSRNIQVSGCQSPTNALTVIFDDFESPDEPIKAYTLFLVDDRKYTDAELADLHSEILTAAEESSAELFEKHPQFNTPIELELLQFDDELQLLTKFFSVLHMHGPDMIVAHNGMGYDYPVLLVRLLTLTNAHDAPIPTVADLTTFSRKNQRFSTIVRSEVFRKLNSGAPLLYVDRNEANAYDPKENNSSLRMPDGTAWMDSMLNFAKRRITSQSPKKGWNADGMANYLFPLVELCKQRANLLLSPQRVIIPYNFFDTRILHLCELESRDASSIFQMAGRMGVRPEKALSKQISTWNLTIKTLLAEGMCLSNNRADAYNAQQFRYIRDGKSRRAKISEISAILGQRTGAFTTHPRTFDFTIKREFFDGYGNLFIGASDNDFSKMYPSIIQALDPYFEWQIGLPMFFPEMFASDTEFPQALAKLTGVHIVSRALERRISELQALFQTKVDGFEVDDIIEKQLSEDSEVSVQDDSKLQIPESYKVTPLIAKQLGVIYRVTQEASFEKDVVYGFDLNKQFIYRIDGLVVPIVGFRNTKEPLRRMTSALSIDVFSDHSRVSRVEGDLVWGKTPQLEWRSVVDEFESNSVVWTSYTEADLKRFDFPMKDLGIKNGSAVEQVFMSETPAYWLVKIVCNYGASLKVNVYARFVPKRDNP